MPKFTSADIEITATDKTKPALTSAQKGVGKLTQMVKSYGVEIGAAVAVVMKAVRTIGNLTEAYIEQEDAVMKMDSALRAAGNYTPKFSKEMQDLASTLQSTTTYGDETILSMIGLLQSMGRLSQEGLKKTIPLVMDMATGLGMDLNSAATLFGKTLGSNVNALARYGLQLREGMDQAQKMGAIQEWVTERFSGAAAAMAGTFGGKLKQLKNLFGDVKEAIGKMLLEQGAPLINWLLDFLKNGENIQTIGKIIIGFGSVFTTVFTVIIAAIKTTINYYKIWAEAIVATSKILGVLFNPKKWGSGEIKEALQDLGKATTAIAEDTWKVWMESGKRIGTAWENTFKTVDYTITTTANNVNYLGEQMDETFGDTKGMEEYQAKMAGLRLEVSQAAASMRMVRDENEGLEDDIPDTVAAMDGMSSAFSTVSDDMTMAQEAMAEFRDYMENSFKPSFVSTMETVWTSAKSVLGAIKDTIKGVISDMIKAIARHYAALAAAFAITLQFGKALKYAAAAALFYAAAGAVSRMQQGGIARMQQGGYGDRIPTMLEPGEAVIPRRTVQRNAAAIGLMQTGGEMGVTVPIYLDGKLIAKNTVKRINKGQHTIDTKSVVVMG